ncbi:MAG: ROK family protein [Rubellimicrobium sp.]|nr:ROK family protein [Rubellimicrobium sp.]
MAARPVLAVDLGGTKILAALVTGATILQSRETATDRSGGPEAWLRQIGALVGDWAGEWGAAGITVTGLIHGDEWSALNPGTLDLPARYPLAERARALLGGPVALANDAQAAAWGEFRHGAGTGTRDMVFLTVSTGIGGGIVAGGRLLAGRSGLAGHAGLLHPLPDGGADLFEDHASGRWIGRAAGQADARAAFAALPDPLAEEAIATSAMRVAALCRNLQLLVDPELIVIGGGVGLAPGYLPRVAAALSPLAPLYRPSLARAALGTGAGVIGIADLAGKARQGNTHMEESES